MENMLPPFPDGWYALGFSEELKPGKLLTRRFAGKDVVLFRTKTGRAAAVDAYCPHMGAHFGHGGTVEGETIRCPFHGFCFNTDGDCVSTAYGTKPNPKGKLKSYPLLERNQILMVYHHHDNLAPDWEIPELEPDGYNPPLFTTYELDSHPQETSENSVDLGHLSIVHGYTAVEILKTLNTNGPYLNAAYTMTRSADFLGLSTKKVKANFEIHMHGLGYSFVDTHVPSMDMRVRHFVLATPADKGKLQLRLGLSVKRIDKPSKINPLLSLMPNPVVNRLISIATFKGFKHDVQQDFHIWQNKTYMHPPALVAGDGPVGQYRAWAKQFYQRAPIPQTA